MGNIFTSLFGRKVGGTAVGNLIRNAASAATGGVLGQGNMLITQEEYDRKHLTDSEYFIKYSTQKPDAKVTVMPYLVNTVGAVAAGALENIKGLNAAGITTSNPVGSGGGPKGYLVAGAGVSTITKYLKIAIPILIGFAVILYFKTTKK